MSHDEMQHVLTAFMLGVGAGAWVCVWWIRKLDKWRKK